jgi:hypothetical protein
MQTSDDRAGVRQPKKFKGARAVKKYRGAPPGRNRKRKEVELLLAKDDQAASRAESISALFWSVVSGSDSSNPFLAKNKKKLKQHR